MTCGVFAGSGITERTLHGGDGLNFALPANGEAGLYRLTLDTNPVDPAKVGTDRQNYKVTYTKK